MNNCEIVIHNKENKHKHTQTNIQDKTILFNITIEQENTKIELSGQHLGNIENNRFKVDKITIHNLIKNLGCVVEPLIAVIIHLVREVTPLFYWLR